MNPTLPSRDGPDIDVDEETIDDAVAGAGAGHGILASMLSWIRGAVTRPPAAPGPLGGVSLENLAHIDPKASASPGGFDAAVLMRSLQSYATRYAQHLSGDGLVLRLGVVVPPSAFPALGEKAPFARALEAASVHVGDYANLEAAVRVISDMNLSQSRSVPEAQVAWLANAAMVRAAVSMSAFVFGRPRLEFQPPPGAVALVFEHANQETRVPIECNSSPLSVHRQSRLGIQHIWRARLAAQTTEVSREFITALMSQQVPGEILAALKWKLDEALSDFHPLLKMRFSSAAFIDIQAVYKECASFVAGADRVAVRNALRHSTQGLHWGNYFAHLSPEFQNEVTRAEAAGALAHSRYSVALLSALNKGDGEDLATSSVISLGPGSIGLPGASQSSGAIWAGGGNDHGYSGQLTQRFMAALDAAVSGATREALCKLSPRYFCALATGHPKGKAFECQLSETRAGLNATLSQVEEAERAGRLLATALNMVVASSPVGRSGLPWARVLSSAPCYRLLLSTEPEPRATAGLVNLISYANALRAKGLSANDVVPNLPSAAECMDAPQGNAVGSLAGRLGAPAMRGQSHFDRAALNLVRGLVALADPVETQTVDANGVASRKLQWVPGLLALRVPYEGDPNVRGGFRLALQNPEGRKDGTWSLMQVSAWHVREQGGAASAHQTLDAHTFRVRGEGSAEEAGCLLFDVQIPENTSFRAMNNRRQSGDGWSYIDMHAMSGEASGKRFIATQTLASDRAAIPQMHSHRLAAEKLWVARLSTMLVTQPLQSAAAFPAVAEFLWAGGRLTDHQLLKPVPMAVCFKLARACLGAGNAHGLGLLCSLATKPSTRSSSGRSLLDLALESTQHHCGMAALRGLKENSRLADAPGELAAMVQASFGKLIERHPELIPLAIKCGARADETSMKAWQSLHPLRHLPELQAAMNEAVMNSVIDAGGSARSEATSGDRSTRSVSSIPTPSNNAPRPRRRVGAI